MAGFDLTALNAYVDESKTDLITKSVLGSKTAGIVRVIPNIKSAQAVDILDASDVTAQDGGTCGFNALGGTTITQVNLAVADVAFMEEYCLKALNAYYTQQYLKAGSADDEMGGLEGAFINAKLEAINSWLELKLWQGNVAGNSDLFDGFLVQLGAAGIDGNTGALTALDSTNIIDAIFAMVAVQPEELMDKENNRLFLSPGNMRMYKNALVKANMYHVNVESGKPGMEDFYVPGTNIMATATPGLSGTDRMILAQDDNLVMGTDLVDEASTTFELFYDKASRSLKFTDEFKAGTNIIFKGQVVDFELTV